MQRLMTEKLNCPNWNKVVQYHPDSSKSHASSRKKGASKEVAPKPILEDVKIMPWRQLQENH